MIRAIRMRPVQKPFITQQIIYNHREEQADTNSDMSFLKMSENTSKQLNSSPEVDHFSALQAHLCKLQQKSALKLNRAKLSLNFLEATDSRPTTKRAFNENTFRQIVEENKQNFRVTYRQIPIQAQQNENMQQCNFQMDQNLNYVKNTFYNSRNVVMAHQQLKSLPIEFYSLGNSRQTIHKQQSQVLNQNKKVNHAAKHLVRSRSISNDREQLVARSSSRKMKDNNRFSQGQNQSSRRGRSMDSQCKKGRIYEQILSLYSIPKLLAMEPRTK